MGSKHSKGKTAISSQLKLGLNKAKVLTDTFDYLKSNSELDSHLLDAEATPPTARRRHNSSRLLSRFEIRNIQDQKGQVATVDVRISHNRIKKHSHMKLDTKKLGPTSMIGHQLSASTLPQTSRSELIAENYYLEPLQYTDPYDRFRLERFDQRAPLDRPVAKVNRMSLNRPRASFGENEVHSKFPKTSVITDLVSSYKLTQKASNLPQIKDKVVTHKTIEESQLYSRLRQIGKTPRTKDVRYRIKNTNDKSLTKTESSLSSNHDRELPSKAGKSWLWKGSYGKFRIDI